MRISKNKTTAIVTLLFILIIHGARFLSKRSMGTSSQTVISARTKGNPKAPLHIIEYKDYQCPACSKGSILLRKYIMKYPSQIYLEYRHYPITKAHPNSLRIAIYAECTARQNKFWLFNDMLAVKRKSIKNSIDIDEKLISIAKEIDLDLEALTTCVEDKEIENIILKEKAHGKFIGVKATPTYFINGKIAVGLRSLKEELVRHFGDKEK